MTDHDAFDDDTPVVTPGEAAALALLDRRGHAAAASLRAAVGPAPRPGIAPADRRNGAAAPEGSTDAGDPTMIDLSSAPGRGRPRRGARRPMWLAAAAVVTVVGLAAASALRSDEPPSDMTGSDEQYLVAGWLPAGFAADGAVDVGATMMAPARPGEVVVYGDGGVDDPWASPTISATFVATPPDLLPQDRDRDERAQPIAVGDQPATFVDRDGGATIEWAADGGTLAVRGDAALAVGAVLAAAEGTDAEPAIAAEALPEDYIEIARGPLSAAGNEFRSLYGADGDELFVAYSSGDSGDSDASVVVIQRPGPEAAVEVVRVHEEPVRVTEVRGQQAVLVGGSALQWREPSGMVITVLGEGVSDADLARIGEELEPAGPGEIDRLIELYEERFAPGGGAPGGGSGAPETPLEDGQTEVAAGEHAGEQWRLLATRRADETGIDLWYGDGGSGTSWPGDPATVTIGALEVAASQAATWPAQVLFGVVTEGASLTAEVPGEPPAEVELVDMPGWDHRGFVLFLPADARGDVVLTARGPDGEEIARTVEPVVPPAGG